MKIKERIFLARTKKLRQDQLPERTLIAYNMFKTSRNARLVMRKSTHSGSSCGIGSKPQKPFAASIAPAHLALRIKALPENATGVDISLKTFAASIAPADTPDIGAANQEVPTSHT